VGEGVPEWEKGQRERDAKERVRGAKGKVDIEH